MNIVVLTADEPLYLPAFFTRFLAERAADTRAVFMAPSRYGKDTTFAMVRKYIGAFGWLNFARLAWRTAGVKIRDKLALGRKSGVFQSIPAAARHYDVVCETTPDVNADAFLQRLRDLETDLIVSVSCPQIFKQPLIDLPRLGCLNIHGARLPQYRGIAPSFWMMSRGETLAGVTVFLVTERIDLGHVVVAEEFPILPDETLDQFVVRSKRLHCDAVLRAVKLTEDGDVQARPLTNEGGSYFGFPTRQAYREFRRRGRRLW